MSKTGKSIESLDMKKSERKQRIFVNLSDKRVRKICSQSQKIPTILSKMLDSPLNMAVVPWEHSFPHILHLLCISQ